MNTNPIPVPPIPNGAVLRLTLSALAIMAATSPAFADFRLCNDSFDVLNVAVARDPGGGFRSEGWWTVAPNRCAVLLRGDIDARYLYLHAIDVFNQPVLDGTIPFCVAETGFSIQGEQDCWARGHIEAGFIEIDTLSATDWTAFVSETGAE
ncbi:DUF1036 domain-containing protein [Roseibaca sp. V10]|uniref:DUF1036 domain-containing protein n=1 Tax=Roseinatronobacter domitianus TaxID=2940293 RepID=A0ABT0M2V2_9RHOB|nr:DUF1036 domain-containing protein [Roseibaca domitiana]MCL1629182.1 DUF1036 domain-containing protein [Roseibaca domitiana]